MDDDVLPDDVDIAAVEDNAERAAALMRTIGSKCRLLILCQLVKGEKSVGELEQRLGISQSALSQHLMVLRRHDVVQTRRSAQMIFYSLKGREVASLLGTLYDLYCVVDEEAACLAVATA